MELEAHEARPILTNFRTMAFHQGCSEAAKKRSGVEDLRSLQVDLKLFLTSKCRGGMWAGRMSSNMSWYVIWVFISFASFSLAFIARDPRSLDDFMDNYTSTVLSKHRTDVIYNISPPSNFSGMEVSVVRLRSSTFWARGANFSYFDIPPKVVVRPYVKRLAIVYENLGNWSSSYYELPGYTFLTPVIGFRALDASSSTRSMNRKLHLTVYGDPIGILFPLLQLTQKSETVKCVRFDPGGSMELSHVVRPNLCTTRAQGHFSIAVPRRIPPPSPASPPSPPSSRRVELREWWVIGFVAGLIVLIVLSVTIAMCCKAFGSKKIREMEKQTNKAESLSTTWIGSSKMPSAIMTRTQAILELDSP
ncbi:hypothetical protein Ancab_037936 [Ancistrocladus abbreviatus]